MFESHAKRMAVQRVHELKNAMVSGAWANSTYDDGNDTRQTILDKIDGFVESAINAIYNVQPDHVEELDRENNPFFAAMKVPTIDPTIDHERLIEG